MGYIARAVRDLWQRKQTLSSGFALGLGPFTTINPWPRAITLTYYRRAALEKWKQYNGSTATYKNLIVAFERAGHKDFAETVQRIAGM